MEEGILEAKKVYEMIDAPKLWIGRASEGKLFNKNVPQIPK